GNKSDSVVQTQGELLGSGAPTPDRNGQLNFREMYGEASLPLIQGMNGARSVNLAGGTHHAHADRGQGFCVFNDAAIAARLMQAERRVTRVGIIDLDVHQGDGTASILANDDSIFTLSLHAQNNYPFDKACSDLDIALPDGTDDQSYLQQLDHALSILFDRFDPQLIIYLAGADPYEGDRLGRLSLSVDGLAQRDRAVLTAARARQLPVAIAMAGGYGHRIEETVAIHLQTLHIAREYVIEQPERVAV
nr:histone deacetylase [Oxalobacteraceae bacterium]